MNEINPPVLSSGLCDEAAAQTPAIEKPGRRPATQSLFDASRLPTILSIGPGSEIRAFLAPGAPEDLTRVALRRSWSTDPAIRDFIGLSDNSWDFNAPEGVPGFGSLMTHDTRRVTVEAEISVLSASEQNATGPNKSER